MNKNLLLLSAGFVGGGVFTVSTASYMVVKQAKKHNLNRDKIRLIGRFLEALGQYMREHPEMLEDPIFEQAAIDATFLSMMEDFKCD